MKAAFPPSLAPVHARARTGAVVSQQPEAKAPYTAATAQASFARLAAAAQSSGGAPAAPVAQSSEIADFSAWLAHRRAQGADDLFMARADAAQSTVIAISDRARSSGGFDDPLGFVRSLGAEDLMALQHMHGLADPIDTASLTREGAHNLLLPGDQARDLDGDGLTNVGASQRIVFPPADASPAFRQAWASSTEGLDPGVRITMELQMWGASRGDTPDAAEATNKTDYGALVDRLIASTQESLRYGGNAAQRTHAEALVAAYAALGVAIRAG